MRQRGPIVWFHEAKQVREKLGARWRGMLFHTFGDYLPLPAVALLSRISQKLPSVREAAFVRSHWLDHSRDFALEERKCFPKDNLNVMRLATIHSQNQALFNLAGLHETGVDERDPTTDRRLMEFSFRLPPAQLLKDGVSRPLMRRALAHRLPDAILSNPLRGLQGADWYEQLRPGEIHDILDEVAASAGVNAVLDLQQIRTAVNHWPAGGWDKPRIVAIYRRSLPLALSTAVFIHEFEQLIRRRELDRIFSS
jgi:asparagine synthase (glutamine-hydrolysing)